MLHIPRYALPQNIITFHEFENELLCQFNNLMYCISIK